MVNKKNSVGVIVVIAVIAAAALGLAIGLPFAIGLDYFNANPTVGGLYWAVKATMCAGLLAAAIWLMIGERVIPSTIIISVTAGLLQGLAPLCRVAQFCGSFNAGFCGLMLGIGIVVFVVMFAIAIKADKMQVEKPEHKADEIKVKKERKGFIPEE